jgi:hypothetical protein
MLYVPWKTLVPPGGLSFMSIESQTMSTCGNPLAYASTFAKQCTYQSTVDTNTGKHLVYKDNVWDGLQDQYNSDRACRSSGPNGDAYEHSNLTNDRNSVFNKWKHCLLNDHVKNSHGYIVSEGANDCFTGVGSFHPDDVGNLDFHGTGAFPNLNPTEALSR